jgi:nitroreductase
MDKPANNDFPIHELLRARWSPRAFSSAAVDRETVRSLLEAARWTPSCFNAQPWRFLVATRDDAAAHARMVGCLSSGNRVWAEAAPVLMIAVACDTFAHNGSANRWGAYDTGQAVAMLTVQAQALGLRVHQMGGFDGAAVRELYGVPDGYTPMAAVALGHHGDVAQLPDELADRERSARTRTAQAGFAFGDAWEEAW